LLRAAAKNFESVVVVCNPSDYAAVTESLKLGATVPFEQRKKLALKAFRHTAAYDAAIANWFQDSIEGHATLSDSVHLSGEVVQQLRYGENPHQKGTLGVNCSDFH